MRPQGFKKRHEKVQPGTPENAFQADLTAIDKTMQELFGPQSTQKLKPLEQEQVDGASEVEN